MYIRLLVAGGLFAGVTQTVSATAQQSSPHDATDRQASAAAVPSPGDLDSLVARANAASPQLRAARARVDAARARVRPASTLPDPVLMLGIINQPLGGMPATSTPQGTMTTSDGPDPMTMRMIGVEQMIPYPGKRALRRREAQHDADASEAALDAAQRQVVRDVKSAYYELAFLDKALGIVTQNHQLLASLVAVTEARYSVSAAAQQDVLKARVEAARLGETVAGLMERHRATLAQLNAALDRPSEAPVTAPSIPDAIAHAAIPSVSDEIHFASTLLGSRSADSPLRPLLELQEAAIRRSPDIRGRDAMIAAQSTRAELARKDYLPDVGVSLQYGQRSGGLPDMVSAIVSVPIPIFKGRKQDQAVVEATEQVAVLDAERHAAVNAIRADVARLVADIEQQRTRLALAVKAILPQSRAALTSATASYQVNKVDFLTVLASQATVFSYETDYFRALSDFATNVAELERVVGEQVLR